MSPIGRQIEILLAKNANLRRTRDLLLPRLVSGEIAVHE
jgi:type I restriction enzyme S subunit